jgi:repressor LexA
MAKALTKRQSQILAYIIACIRDNGYPPTIAEIGEHFSIASTNGVNDHLVALERKGYIARTSKARSIQVVPSTTDGVPPVDAVMVPLVGRVAAGQPILALENVESHIPIRSDLGRKAAFCLRVQGESMIEDGILDGDIIVVSSDEEPRRGDAVVALVDGEVTVKRYYPQGQTIELRPANASMKSIIVPADQVALQGVVMALQRTFR